MLDGLVSIFNYPSQTAKSRIETIAKRDLAYHKKDFQKVVDILDDVRRDGDTALIKYTNQYDSPKLDSESIKVTDKEIEDAQKKMSKSFISSLKRAVNQIEAFHKKQLNKSWICTEKPGVLLGQIVNPVNAVGVYVPGGKGGSTPLISSVLMGSIPAKTAGVQQISMVTPPMENGFVNPHLLVAAKMVGVDTIYKIGGAWAIGALAYGTKTVGNVDVIVGPGNIFVTLAKKIVAGTVGIDLIAGPSEILVIADANAKPEFIAADLLSQAEHDTMASAILITTSEKIAKDVLTSVEKQISKLARQEIARKSLESYGMILVVPTLSCAFDIANKLAPEHLELHIKNPFEHIGYIKNAGAIFLGDYTPEAMGDYIAGPNHVLPTSGTARFASALSVDNFIKKTTLIHYSANAFVKEATDVINMAEIEGLDGHANSVKVRISFENKQ